MLADARPTSAISPFIYFRKKLVSYSNCCSCKPNIHSYMQQVCNYINNIRFFAASTAGHQLLFAFLHFAFDANLHSLFVRFALPPPPPRLASLMAVNRFGLCVLF